MPTLEDELRIVMERVSTLDAAAQARPVERRAEVGGRIRRRRRTRATTSMAALALVMVAGGTAAADWPHRDQKTPASATPGPSDPAGVANNTTTLVSQTIVMPSQTSVTVDFRPTSWRLVLATSCVSGTMNHLSISLNDHFVEDVPCKPASTTDDGESDRSFDEQFWKAQGVRLGQPSTLSATVVDESYNTPDFAIAMSGVASIDVYQSADS